MARRTKRRHDLTPTSMAFLAVESFAAERQPAPHITEHRFRRGTLLVTRREGFKRCREWETTSSNWRKLWGDIGSRVDPSRPLHLFAYDLPRVLTLSGFWRLLIERVIGIAADEVDWKCDKVPEAKAMEWQGIVCDSDPPVIVSCWHQRGGRIHLADTRNYFRDWKPGSEDCEQVAASVRERIVKLTEWHRRERLGPWGPTAASLAMSAFRSKSSNAAKIRVHTDIDRREQERSSFYGGRVELYFRGQPVGNVWQVDINSLYPSVMRDLAVPVQVCSDDFGFNSVACSGGVRLHACSARVLIETTEPVYPVRDDSGVFFPTGKFSTTLAGPELEHARQRGRIREIYSLHRYKLARVFTEFVDWQERSRKSARYVGDRNAEGFAKLLGNSLYGKFGQRIHRWESVAKHVDLPETSGRMTPRELKWYLWLTEPVQGETLSVNTGVPQQSAELRQIGNHWQMKLPPGEHPNAFPAIAAWITSQARLEVWELMNICGRENVYHVSTDALLISDYGKLNLEENGLIDPHEYGLVKVVDGPMQCELIAPNWFRLGQQWTRAGLPEGSLETQDDRWLIQVRESMPAIIKRGLTGGVQTREETRLFALCPGRGEIQSSGWIHAPHLGD